MPLPLGRDLGRHRAVCFRNQLDSLVKGGDGVQAAAAASGLEEDQGVGGILLAERPGLLVGWVAEQAGGRGRFEVEGCRGRVGFEEGEELGGQFEEFVGC